MTTGRRLGVTAALTVGPIAAWRFAQAYRARAGYPHRHAPEHDPSDLGLAFETLSILSGGVDLPAWWIPAREGAPGPAVLLVHGWESARDRTLPNALLLNAIGMHVLTIDIRGHGLNPPEELPLTAGEFGADALAGVQALLARADVTAVGILGHSMGGIGALLAAAAEPRVRGVVAASTPADPYRLTRQTFRLARLPLPGPLAWPLAWLTTHVFLEPRGHTVGSV
jgi:pimeloyl-ACP methyl ester carboxylesterase